MIAIKNVLVATDFSEPSKTALVYGRELARTFGAALHLVHVMETMFALQSGGEIAVTDFAPIVHDLETAARKQLEASLGDDDRRELHARTALLAANNPAVGIAAHARDIQADVIVIGTHGRGALSKLLLGSVAERVVRIAPCPVLTVRHAQHEFVVPDALQAVQR
jgi:nucleotide-binding universal stress UspA family protein